MQVSSKKVNNASSTVMLHSQYINIKCFDIPENNFRLEKYLRHRYVPNKKSRYCNDDRAMRPKYESPENCMQAQKSADVCARIFTLQCYHYLAVRLFSKYSNLC